MSYNLSFLRFLLSLLIFIWMGIIFIASTLYLLTRKALRKEYQFALSLVLMMLFVVFYLPLTIELVIEYYEQNTYVGQRVSMIFGFLTLMIFSLYCTIKFALWRKRKLKKEVK